MQVRIRYKVRRPEAFTRDGLVRETFHTDGKEQGDALFSPPQAGHQALRGLQKGQDHVPFGERAPVGECLVREEEDRDTQDAQYGLFRIGLTPHQRGKYASKYLSIQNLTHAQILKHFLSQTQANILSSLLSDYNVKICKFRVCS